MYFRRIPASAIASHGSTVLFNFIITTAVAYVPKMGDPVLVYRILDKPPPPHTKEKQITQWFCLSKTRFKQNFLKLGLVVWLPLQKSN